jgi:hypothetical protein
VRRRVTAVRLTRSDGVPSLLARSGVVVLMASAAAIGWAAGPDRDEPGARPRAVVAIERLSGELPMARDEARAKLRSVATLPRYRGSTARAAARLPEPEPAVTASATPTRSPEPEGAVPPELDVVPVATPAPAAPAPRAAPPRPAPAPAPRRPAPTPAPTFDSSG